MTSTVTVSEIAPWVSREPSDPVRAVIPCIGAATAAATTAAGMPTARARSWAREALSTTSARSPAAAANSAPRENDRYSPRPSGAQAAPPSARSAGERRGSPIRRSGEDEPEGGELAHARSST